MCCIRAMCGNCLQLSGGAADNTSTSVSKCAKYLCNQMNRRVRHNDGGL